MDKQLYSIGQMAAMSQVTVQTLRYYDKIGLLQPAIVATNGYRYYSLPQTITIRIVQHLQEVGFSLTAIKTLLSENDLNVIIEKYKQRHKEIESEITALRQAQQRLQLQISSLTAYEQHSNPQLIELRSEEQRLIAFTRYRSACGPNGFAMRFNELQSIIKSNDWSILGNLSAAFYDHYTQFNYNNADIEVFAAVTAKRHNESCYLRIQPAYRYISALHKGPHTTHPQTYQRMMQWAAENGYTITLPSIERYIVDLAATNDPNKFVTELRLPILPA